jgi:hypothetical protein
LIHADGAHVGGLFGGALPTAVVLKDRYDGTNMFRLNITFHHPERKTSACCRMFRSTGAGYTRCRFVK